MKILFINQPLCNRGDEAAHKALMRSLLATMPELYIEVLFLDTYSQNSIRQFDIHHPRAYYSSLYSDKFTKWGEQALWNGRYFLWNFDPVLREMMRRYKGADWILSSPGGISMGGMQNWNHLFLLKMAKYCKKKLAYYSRSFGPFPTETFANRRFKDLSYEMLHYFHFLSIRDKETERLADEIGLNYVSTVDTAFLESPNVEIPYEIKQLIGTKNYMVFVPNLLIWHYAYKGKIKKEKVISYFSAILDIMMRAYPEYNIVMLPQTFDYHNYEWDDINMFRDIAKNRSDNRIIVIPDCYSSDIQQTIIKDCKLLVGARYHSVVFSINQAVPFVALSYEHKIKGLLETLGKQDCMVDISSVFESEENIRESLYRFSIIVKEVKADIKCRDFAKAKSQACLERFVNCLKESK